MRYLLLHVIVLLASRGRQAPELATTVCNDTILGRRQAPELATTVCNDGGLTTPEFATTCCNDTILGGLTAPARLRFVGANGLTLAQAKRERVQHEADPDQYVARERASRMRFRVGLRIVAGKGAVQRATATVADPIEWPEQELSLVAEDAPQGIEINTRKVGRTAQQMIMRIPLLTAGSTMECTRTYDLTRWTQRVKSEARAQLGAVSPEHARALLLPSDGIESNHAEIRKFASESIGDKSDAWGRVEALFHATRARIKYVQGPFAGALAGLRTGQGDCEELGCLFIASCRASGIPARMVWGPQHTWSEFAMVDPDGELVWIPADPSKERELGVINHFTPILQKGDRFSVPEMPRKLHRYLAPLCTGMGTTPRLEPIESIESADDISATKAANR